MTEAINMFTEQQRCSEWNASLTPSATQRHFWMRRGQLVIFSWWRFCFFLSSDISAYDRD